MKGSDWMMKNLAFPGKNIQDYKFGRPAVAIQNETTPKHLALIMWLPVNYSSNELMCLVEMMISCGCQRDLHAWSHLAVVSA